MTISTGTRLGPYEILSPLGAGGMGEVYRARDTKLHRDVAIKVLPESLATDADTLARFEREAHAVAALNHPNILSIHDFGSEDGIAYAVMELLEGQDLRSRLDGGALPQRKTVEIAVQIAHGLAAAHEKGIIHRDLKPENVFLTSDGRVKILDFGLAKVVSRETAQTSAPTTPAGTEPGTVMGTVGYMSPEQVRAREVDARTDIFSFGAILYEMLSGRRAFRGESHVETMNSILKEEPPELSESGRNVSPALDRIVRHCLEKAPQARFHSAGDLAFALEALGDSSSSAGVPALSGAPPARRRAAPARTALLALFAIAVIAAALAVGRVLWRAPVAAWSGTLLGGPEIAFGPRVSPDGQTLGFQAMVGEMTQAAVMKPESGNWQVLSHKSDAGYVGAVAWSPDGNRLYFDRGADVPMGVYSVPVLGGDEQLVAEDAAQPVPLRDGSLLVIRLNAERELQLFRFWPDSGRLQGIALSFASIIWPQVGLFPDGKEAFALARRIGSADQASHLYALDIASGKVRRIATDVPEESIEGLAAMPDNASILASVFAQDLTRVTTLPRRGGKSSPPLFTLTGQAHNLDAAADGSIYAGVENFRQIFVRFPAEGGRATSIGSAASLFDSSLLPLPDGRTVVQLKVGGRRRLTTLAPGKDVAGVVTTNEETSSPVTTLGAGDLAFLIGPAPRRTIAVASIANGRVKKRIPFEKGEIGSLAGSPDGKTIYVAAGGAVWAIPEAGAPRRICAGNSVAAEPDGRSLLVQVLESGRTRLLRVPVEGGAGRDIALNGPFHMTFDPLNSAEISRDGHRLLVPLASLSSWFFVPGEIDLTSGRMTRIPTDHFGDYHSIAWAPDGTVVAQANEARSSIWKFTRQP